MKLEIILMDDDNEIYVYNNIFSKIQIRKIYNNINKFKTISQSLSRFITRRLNIIFGTDLHSIELICKDKLNIHSGNRYLVITDIEIKSEIFSGTLYSGYFIECNMCSSDLELISDNMCILKLV